MGTFTLRVMMWFALLVTLTAVVVLVTGGGLLYRQSTRSLDLMQRVEGAELVVLLGEDVITPDEVRGRIESDADSDAALFFIQVRRIEGGAVVYQSANLKGAEIPMFSGEVKRMQMTKVDGIGTIRVSEYRVGEWRIQVGSALSAVYHVVGNYTRVSLILLGVTAVLSVVAGFIFSRVVLSPVRVIEETARRISADNLSERIPVPPTSSRDELARLAELLNQTFDRLEESFSQVQKFTADVSHELKTPLSLIRLSAEKLLAKKQGLDAETEGLLTDVVEEANRMGRTIDALLFIARTEAGALELKKTEQEMEVFVEDFAEDARVLCEDAGLVFVNEKRDKGTVMMVPQLMRQLLFNLLSNAMKVSQKGGTVCLSSERLENGKWRLSVSDEGEGLPAEMLERIFERFVRHNPPPGEAHGHGLGLAICRSVAELHGGRIWAESAAGGRGLRVTVEF